MNSKNLSSYPLLTEKAPKLGRKKICQFTRQINISFVPNVKTQNFDHKNCKFTRASISYDIKSVQMWLKIKNESDKQKYLFLSQIPKRQPDHAVIFKDICRAVFAGETVSEK